MAELYARRIIIFYNGFPGRIMYVLSGVFYVIDAEKYENSVDSVIVRPPIATNLRAGSPFGPV